MLLQGVFHVFSRLLTMWAYLDIFSVRTPDSIGFTEGNKMTVRTQLYEPADQCARPTRCIHTSVLNICPTLRYWNARADTSAHASRAGKTFGCLALQMACDEFRIANCRRCQTAVIRLGIVTNHIDVRIRRHVLIYDNTPTRRQLKNIRVLPK